MHKTTRPIFVADHLAIDFLNTVFRPQDEVIDWLETGRDLVRWAYHAELIDHHTADRMRERHADSLDEVARQAREFRDWWRGFVTRKMGRPLRGNSAAIAPLNELLARDRSIQQLEPCGRDEEGAQEFAMLTKQPWNSPEELLDPIARAVGDLLLYGDFRLIRACEGTGCMLLFLDCTKWHGRRWCSMAVCGNRAKVAAHRARKAQGKSRGE